MNTSRGSQRNRRSPSLAVDALEVREVMSAGMGSTFAIVPGSIDTAGQTSTSQIHLDPQFFTGGRRGQMVVGIDVAADPSSSVKPQIVSIKDAKGRNIRIEHTRYSQTVVKASNLFSAQSSAVTATLAVPKTGKAPADYTVQVKGADQNTGGYLLGFYLPGDADGNGAVTADDLKTMGSKFGSTSSDSTYAFDSDANRDGKIDAKDLRIATQNMGVKTTISPVINVNLDPATDGPLHTRITNVRNVHFTGVTSPDATVTFSEINGNSPGATTTADASGNYSIYVQLGDGSNTFNVTSADPFGQKIQGTITPVTWTASPPTVTNTTSTGTTTTL